jgi:hypothetical protein
MTTTPSPKPRPISALLTATIVALTLYAATWPAVEIEASRIHLDLQRIREFSLPSAGLQKIAVELDPGPAWLATFYYPMHALRKIREGDNAASRYWTWWYVHLLKQRTQDFKKKVRESQRARGRSSP